MSNLTLDGGNRVVGTEFIKLLATGSSNLATEEYVDDAIAQGGGGGGASVDAYTKAETDNLLNNKLNVNNPQDITGNLRLDPTNGLSKIILNAVSPPNANDDFYCNGSGQFNGTLRVSVLTSDGDVNADGCNADTFNSHIITNDIVFKHNDVEYMRYNATNDTIDLSKELNLGSSTLKINSLNTNGLNDMTFGVDTLGEFLRFQVSDFTVRVPDNRSFLSQNVIVDNIQPLAFANDVVFNGGNSTNDAYEEYMRLDASTEKENISKEVKFEHAIQLNQSQSIKWTNVFIREIQGASRPEFDLIVNGSTSHMRLWVAGAIKLALTNTVIACKNSIDAEQGITVFNGQQIRTNIVNSNGNNNIVIQRNSIPLITLNSSNQIQLSGDLSLPTSNTQYIRFTNCNIRQGVAGDPAIVYFDFNNDASTGQYRFYIDSNTILHLRPLATTISNTLEVNTINSNGDNNLLFQRNGSPYMTFNTDRIDIDKPCHFANEIVLDTANQMSLKQSLEGSANILDIVNLYNTQPIIKI